jgi:hypothetical protein
MAISTYGRKETRLCSGLELLGDGVTAGMLSGTE